MQYNDWVLFAFGLGGVFIHNLIKIYDLKKGGKFSFTKYYTAEWPAITISLIIVILCIFGKHEVAALDAAGNALGAGFVAIGYMGQSLFVKYMGRISKVLGEDTKNPE